MIGTLINCAAIIAGGLLGLVFKKGIKPSFETSINKALGAAILIIGANGAISSMFRVKDDGTLSSSGELLLVIFLVVGTLIGELLRLDDRLNGLSKALEKRFRLSGFAIGFVNATILFCVGAMAIIGAINDGLRGDTSVLLIKSTLDGISAIVLGASLGVGVIFSAVPVLLYQGGISLFSGYIGQALAGDLMTQVCAVGYAIILCIGINFLASSRIKTANMLPAVLLPPVYSGLQALWQLIVK